MDAKLDQTIHLLKTLMQTQRMRRDVSTENEQNRVES